MTLHISKQCNCRLEINGSDACTLYDYSLLPKTIKYFTLFAITHASTTNNTATTRNATVERRANKRSMTMS